MIIPWFFETDTRRGAAAGHEPGSRDYSLAQSAQPAANSIEAINVAGQRGGSIVVRITLKQPWRIRRPVSRSIIRAHRVELPGHQNALGKNTQEVGDGDLRNMNIVQAGERTRW